MLIAVLLNELVLVLERPIRNLIKTVPGSHFKSEKGVLLGKKKE